MKPDFWIYFCLTLAISTRLKDIPALKDSPLGASATFYCDVDDVDAFYDSCRAAGVDIVKDIVSTWYGMREFYIRDINGYILGFGRREKDLRDAPAAGPCRGSRTAY